MDELWSVQDVATLLGVSGDAVRHHEKRGNLTAIRTRSGVRLFLKKDVLAFVEKRQAAAAAREAKYALSSLVRGTAVTSGEPA